MNCEEFVVSKETWTKISKAGITSVADLLARIGDPAMAAAAALDSFDIHELNEALKRCDFETILIPVPILPLESAGTMLPPPDLLHAILIDALAALARVSGLIAEAAEAIKIAPPPHIPTSEGEQK